MAGCVWILQGIVAVGLWASAATGERHALIILLGNDADGSADDAVAVRGAAHDAAVLANMFLNRRDDFSTRTVIAHRQYAQLLRGRCGGVVEMTGVTTFASLGRGWSQGCYVVVFVMGHVALHRDRRIAVGESLLSPDDFLEVLTSRPFGRMLLFLDTSIGYNGILAPRNRPAFTPARSPTVAGNVVLMYSKTCPVAKKSLGSRLTGVALQDTIMKWNRLSGPPTWFHHDLQRAWSITKRDAVTRIAGPLHAVSLWNMLDFFGRGVPSLPIGNEVIKADGKRVQLDEEGNVVVFQDGLSRFEGKIDGSNYSGIGVIVYASGTQYSGQLRHLARDGFGIMRHRNGKVLFQGTWSAGRPVSKSKRYCKILPRIRKRKGT
ncbi:hypothetical protein PBRA_000675 [Plasmodiophora brassicae]|nr:hypothetical protein PBRA_000675 [Plasmodiophora brassicae]